MNARIATDRAELLQLKLNAAYTHLEEIHQLGGVLDLLTWDQNVYLPPAAAEWRGKQIALISKQIHERFVQPEFVDNVNLLHAASQELSEDDSANIREIKRDLDRQIKLPSDFVAEQARAHSEAQAAWEIARPKNDFASVLPHLEKVFELARREAAYVGYAVHPYDALLDKYEPDATTATIKPLLLDLGTRLAELIPKIQPQFADLAIHAGSYPVEKQEALGRKVARDLGYDFDRGRLDVTAHPFMSSPGPDDKRISTRYKIDCYFSALFGTIHEAGHAIYEQGLVRELAARPLGQAASTGIHESQSRLWENLVGRSRPFASYLHRLLGDFMPAEQQRTTPETLWKEINRVAPSLVRTEADEVTYSQHIIIRTLLEEELVNGTLAVKDLPARWSEMYKKFLGIEPRDHSDGVLQDIHWFCGLIGYFPTYALGNIYGACMMERARSEVQDLDGRIERGEFGPLKEWLNRNVHAHGRRYSPGDLVAKITGKGLSTEPFLSYLRTKFGVR